MAGDLGTGCSDKHVIRHKRCAKIFGGQISITQQVNMRYVMACRGSAKANNSTWPTTEPVALFIFAGETPRLKERWLPTPLSSVQGRRPPVPGEQVSAVFHPGQRVSSRRGAHPEGSVAVIARDGVEDRGAWCDFCTLRQFWLTTPERYPV